MKMVPVEAYTTDAVLIELINMVGTGRLNHQSAQAAVWTRTDNLSWADLARKFIVKSGQKRPYFLPAHLQRAQLLVATATGRMRERAASDTDTEDTTESVPSRVRSGS